MTTTETIQAPGPEAGATPEQPHLCPECTQKAELAPERYVYALGKLELRFPTVGIEREYQQRERAMARAPEGSTRGERLSRVLEANEHLAHRMCYVLMVGATPAYLLTATGPAVRREMLRATREIGHPEHWVLAIGRLGPLGSPATCGGLMAPIVGLDQLYSFRVGEFVAELRTRLEAAVKPREITEQHLQAQAREVFERVVNSVENLGATDMHRALNYVLMQHPGFFLANHERAERCVLERIDTRPILGPGVRRVVAVVLTFLDRATGVPERLFCRVDVTEEWPFVADTEDGMRAPLGFLPYVESELFGMHA